MAKKKNSSIPEVVVETTEEVVTETPGGYHETPIPDEVEQIPVLPDTQNHFKLKQVIEAILFATSTPLQFNKLKDVLQTIDPLLKPKEIQELIQELAEEYDVQERAFSLQEIGDGYMLRTRPEYSIHLEQCFNNKKVERLSHSATEVLAIIAFRQPITRPQIEQIRGVDSSGVLASLLERGLVEMKGKLEAPGRPTLYGTTKLFMEYYGLSDLKDMPQYESLATTQPAELESTQPLQEEQAQTEAADTIAAEVGVEIAAEETAEIAAEVGIGVAAEDEIEDAVVITSESN